MNFRNRNIDLVGKQNLWFGISLVVILIGFISWGAFKLNLGIDFEGGAQLRYRIPENKRPQPGQDATLQAQAKTQLETAKVSFARVQVIGNDTLEISTADTSAQSLSSKTPAIQKALTPILGSNAKPISQDFVGPVIGEELRRNAILGVLLGVSLIALWIYIRYNFAGDGLRYAVAGILALIHDVFVLIGMFALIGHFFPRVEIDSSFIAALLTVVGYSINDSVVIFDRIRENLRLRRRDPFLKVVNDSLLETMSRSINTGLTVLIMLLILVLFGGEAIFNFVLAMLVGIASGLYSSIFNASMVLTAWHRWDEKKALTDRDVRLTPDRVTVGGGNRTGTPRAITATPRALASRPTAPRPVTPVSRPTSFAPTVTNTENGSETLLPTDEAIPDEPSLSEVGTTEPLLTESEVARASVSRTPVPNQKARARRRY